MVTLQNIEEPDGPTGTADSVYMCVSSGVVTSCQFSLWGEPDSSIPSLSPDLLGWLSPSFLMGLALAQFLGLSCQPQSLPGKEAPLFSLLALRFTETWPSFAFQRPGKGWQPRRGPHTKEAEWHAPDSA